MKKKNIIVGARGSKLAVKYADTAIKQIRKIYSGNIELKKITTKGDLVLDRKTSEIGGKGEFIKNIENELLQKKIDIAIHSLKDIPTEDTRGLVLKSFLKRNFPNEVLISNKNISLKKLNKNSVVGTSSARREFQIKVKRPDLKIQLIRGNIDTRINLLNKKKYDAIILAKAGICSLNMKHLISEEFKCEEIVPSAGQGIVVLQARSDDIEILDMLQKINNQEAQIMANCEREVLKILNGDCETAVGVYSEIKNNKIKIIAELFSINGEDRYFCEEIDDIGNSIKIARKIGKYLKAESKGNYKI